VDRGKDIPDWSERCHAAARLIWQYWPTWNGRHFYRTRQIVKNRGDIQFSASIAAPMENILFVKKDVFDRAIDQRSDDTPYRRI
jgi:hypothetical protein